QRLKSALWYSIGQFIDEECLRQNLNATPQFIGALTEMVWTQIGTTDTPLRQYSNTSRDLETFAKHASRSTVNTSDVMLLARRNEGLETVLRGFVEEMRAKDGRKNTTVVKGKGRR
ncbi:uncharacterized protein K441DRAFT_587642, partial [Cenococcum geophilum 1.58]|uniref:uncharacterized protein n=1 Tax=Cenococcum geophilum 1.58 TaxID=794803 RepID=UPI003590134B